MPYPLYSEGACIRLKNQFLHIAIYITENGIADRCHLFLRRCLYALSQATNEAGCDVRGYLEWAESFHMKFGLYHVDLNTQECTLRDDTKYYRHFFQKKYLYELQFSSFLILFEHSYIVSYD